MELLNLMTALSSVIQERTETPEIIAMQQPVAQDN
jgi:hypothetical protein